MQATTKVVVTCVFWELSAIGTTISALLQSGFSDNGIEAIGVLEGSIATGREYLLNIGFPCHIAKLYGTCFEDGAVLLMVRVDCPTQEKTALELLQEYGPISTTVIHAEPLLLSTEGEPQDLRGTL